MPIEKGWNAIAICATELRLDDDCGLSEAQLLKTCPSLLMIGAAKEPDMDEQRP